MSVLRYGTCEKDRERNNPGSEESDEDHVRSRLRYDADKGGKDDHEHGIVADPMVDIDELKSDSKHDKYTERPCKYGRQMLFDYMFPKMSFNEMVGSEEKHEQHNYAEAGEQHVHPILVQQVY